MGNPAIRIDLRLVDRVQIRPEGDEYADLDELEGNAAELDHDRRCDLLLVCGDFEVVLYIADGPDAAERIVAECAPWTREAGGDARALDLPTPPRNDNDRARRPASYGRLVIVSSTPDAEIRSSDELAGYVYELTEPRMRIGRTRENDIVIVHRSISRDHAEVTRDPATGRYAIRDARATNGLRVNGERCIGVELNSGDIVDLGHIRMRFVAPGEGVDDDWGAPASPDPDQFVFIGNNAVRRRGERIEIGSLTFEIDEVNEHALRGRNLSLGHGRALQAALALFVVAAATRGDRS